VIFFSGETEGNRAQLVHGHTEANLTKTGEIQVGFGLDIGFLQKKANFQYIFTEISIPI